MAVEKLLKDAVLYCTESGTYLEDYSGRCMYGDQCLGFTVDNESEAFHVLVNIAQHDHDLAEELCNVIRVDQMGRGLVYYFPTIRKQQMESAQK